jgi:DNA topoisomerase IA
MPTKVLSVAEKPSVAKQLALVMNRGQLPPRRAGKSPYNGNYMLQTTILGNEQSDMVMTSVSGHMMDLEFGPECVTGLVIGWARARGAMSACLLSGPPLFSR